MDNNKLGLKIVRINQGYTDLFEINGDQVWTKNVWDIRKDLENIDNLDGSSAVLMLTSVDTGHILTVASLIEGRITDCISAWIYVPASINIAGKELVEIVDAVKKEILANERNDERLTQLLSKSYESAPATRITTKSNGDKCAYRYYGQGAKYTLSELLKDMCQSYYKNYKSIFLLDNASKLRCLIGDNLSEQKVYSMIVVKSPGKIDSFVPYIGKQVFSNDIYAIEGDNITVEWKLNGFKTIVKTFSVAKGVECPIPTRNEYMMIIESNTIQVRDENSGAEISDYNLRINGCNISNGQRFAISIDIVAQSKVEIYADGYEEIAKIYDLRRQHIVHLKKKRFAYNFVLLSKNHKEIHIEYPTKGFLEESPIEGYRPYRGKLDPYRENWLEYRPFTKAIKITLSIIIAVVLFIGVGAGWYLADYLHKKEISDYKKQISTLTYDLNNAKNNKPAEKRQESQKPESPNWELVVEYLDKNAKWERSAMEKFAAIQGLWDALNYRKFENILQYEEDLKTSKTFSKLVKAIKTNQKSFSAPYCDEGDTEITISTYMSKLGPNVQQQTAVQQDKNQDTQSGQNDW